MNLYIPNKWSFWRTVLNNCDFDIGLCVFFIFESCSLKWFWYLWCDCLFIYNFVGYVIETILAVVYTSSLWLLLTSKNIIQIYVRFTMYIVHRDYWYYYTIYENYYYLSGFFRVKEHNFLKNNFVLN